MKDFLCLVSLVKSYNGKKNVIFPEIRLSKNTVLCIEYPINIICDGQSGLTHKGIGGCFNYWFKKDRKVYQILFTHDRIIFSCLGLDMKTIWTKKYNYIKLIKFIDRVNRDRSILFKESKRKIKRRCI